MRDNLSVVSGRIANNTPVMQRLGTDPACRVSLDVDDHGF
jgi:hypothetical protein